MSTPGFPSPAQDHAESSLNLHSYAVHHPEATYFLRVDGEAMTGAGIFPKDIAVVDRAIDPQAGDVVVAIIDGAYYVRRWERTDEGIWLRTDPPSAHDVPLTGERTIAIWGVVTFVLHSPRRRP